MVGRWAWCCLVSLMAAGCASAPPEPEATTTHTVAATETASAFSVTDTLHLLDAPHLAATLPEGAQDLVLDVPTRGGDQALQWTMPRPESPLTVAATVTLWVDVQGTVVNGASPNGGGDCFWTLVLLIDGEAPASAGACVEEPVTVPTGIRQLVVEIPPLDTSMLKGTKLGLGLFATALASSPDSSIHLLTGTPEHDSLFTVQGLEVPLDMQTVL